jgi:hypothetical protein
VSARHRRLATALLLSLLLHGLLLWRALVPIAGLQTPPAEAPRLQLVWVEPPQVRMARQTQTQTQTQAPASPAGRATPGPAAVRRREHTVAVPPAGPASLPVADSTPAAESAPLATPALPAAPADPVDSHRGTRAMGRLLDSAAGREAVRSAAREDAARPRIQAQREDPLASGLREAAHGDCMKGEFKGGGMGLLSLPMLAAAAIKGECSR